MDKNELNPIKKVISGGQTGADQAGLFAAEKFNIGTGGWMPRNFLTKAGPSPDLGKRFGMSEHPSGYKDRTFANVKDSDGTIRFASNFNSAGEKVTLTAIEEFEKPRMDIDVTDPCAIGEVAEWVRTQNIQVLNVAGNSEDNSPGIFDFVLDYLTRVFEELQNPQEQVSLF